MGDPEQSQSEAGKRPHALPAPPMNPYLAGALTGLAAVLALWAVEMQFGVTPFYGYCAKPLRILWSSFQHPELLKDLGASLRLQLHTYFALGIPLGAALSAWLAGDWRWTAVPALWAKRFGPRVKKRLFWAFIGGFIAVFGVRMAGGCPSGLGLSGIIALSASGFVGLAAFFAGGLITARLIYGGGQREAGGKS
jgi:uncharacterized protein